MYGIKITQGTLQQLCRATDVKINLHCPLIRKSEVKQGLRLRRVAR